MRLYFADDRRVRELHSEAYSWIGTKFMAHQMVKGAGVDCVHLCAALYLSTGLIQEFLPPAYDVDAGPHLNQSQVEAFVEASRKFECVWSIKSGAPRCPVMPGDLLLFDVGRVTHHCGVAVTDEVFVHTLYPHGVADATLQDSTWSKRLRRIYRPLET